MHRIWRARSAYQNSLHHNFSTTAAGMARTYADAVASLNTLQSNFAIVKAISQSRGEMNLRAIPEMIEWCQKIGYEPSDLNRLNAIHIAGTKGKGSTAAFTSSILTQFLGRSGNTKTMNKIGLYTSPHLRFVRERIQLNGQPLSEEQFAKYFFEIWDRLEDAARAAGSDPKDASAKPVYFRFLTLMAYHAYLTEGVDAAIIECGIGGAYDSTNILEKPSVTGITSLGIDHVGILGGTLPEIAWHKAGVMKAGSKCFTPNSQHTEAKAVLEKVAAQQESQLFYVDVDKRMQTGEIKLGLEADFQQTNGSLAAAIATEWLTQHGYASEPDFEQLIHRGLEQVHWGGRCETRHEPGITWCIDGGHTLDSIKLAGQWFANTVLKSPSDSPLPRTRYLIFNQQTRDASALALALHDTLSAALSTAHPFTHAVFCTNTTFRATGFRPDLVSVNTNASDVEALKVQHALAETWKKADPRAGVSVVRTIEEAVGLVRERQKTQGDEVTALVTGSLHLVGGFLEVLEGSGD